MSAIAVPFDRGVLADRLPATAARDSLLVVAGAGLVALLAQVSFPIPPSPVPVTGQTLAVGIVGASLGMRRGASALTLYMLLGLLLPVYAEGNSGWEVIWGASGGYLVGFIAAAAAIGYLAEHGADRRILTTFTAFVAGQALIFACGLIGLKLATDQTWAWVWHNGFEIFLIGGLIKAAIGAALLPSAWRLAGRGR